MGELIVKLSHFEEDGIDRLFRDLDIYAEFLKGPSNKTVVIFPTDRAARAAEKAVIRENGGCIFGENILSWRVLVAKTRPACTRGIELNERFLDVIFKSISGDSAFSATTYGKCAGFPGAVSEMKRTITEIRQNGFLRPDDLEKALSGGRVEIRDGLISDVINVFSMYEKKKSEGFENKKYFDAEDILAAAGEVLETEGARKLFNGAERFIFIGFYDFNVLQKRFVAALIKTAAKTIFAIDADADVLGENAKDHPVCALPAAMVSFLKSQKNIDVKIEIDEDKEVAPNTADVIFLSAGAQARREEEYDRSPIGAIYAEDLKDEVERIAADIKRRIIDEGESPSDIAVVFPALGKYVSIVSETFETFRVPYDIAAQKPFSSSPLFELFDSVLDVVEKGFPRATVLKLLASPFVSLEKLGGGDPFELDSLAREAKIYGGDPRTCMDEWRGSLISLKRKSELRVSYDYEDDSSMKESAASKAREENKNKIRRIDEWITRVEKLFGFFKPLIDDGAIRPEAWFNSLSAVFDFFDLEDTVYEGKYAENDAGLRKAAGESLRAMIGVMRECENAISMTAEREGVKRGDIIGILRSVADTAEIPAVRDASGVRIIGLYETRGVSFKNVYIGGLTETDFPRRSKQPVFLNGNVRAALGLRSIRDDKSEERYLFRRLLSVSGGITVSYPGKDGDVDLLKSPYLVELERCADIIFTPDAGKERFFTEKQLLMGIGRSAFGDAADEKVTAASKSIDDGNTMKRITRAFEGLEIEKRRKSDVLGEYDGIISSPELLEYIANSQISERDVTATRIDNYARCPFKYFCSRFLLGLDEPEDVQEDIDPRMTGEIVHEILKQFYCERISGPGDVAEAVTNENISDAGKRMLAIAKGKLRGVLEEGVFMERFVRDITGGLDADESDARPGRLRAFLDGEAKHDLRMVPVFLEAEFNGEKPAELGPGRLVAPPMAMKAGEISFRLGGKIDRIDKVTRGGADKYFVQDYKTGTPSKADLIKRGLDFQLVVYIILASSVFKIDSIVGAAYRKIESSGNEGKLDSLIVRVEYVSTNENEFPLILRAKSKDFYKGVQFEEFIEKSYERIGKIVTAVSKGIFSCGFETEPHCRICEFSGICRRDDERMERIRSALAERPGDFYIPDGK